MRARLEGEWGACTVLLHQITIGHQHMHRLYEVSVCQLSFSEVFRGLRRRAYPSLKHLVQLLPLLRGLIHQSMMNALAVTHSQRSDCKVSLTPKRNYLTGAVSSFNVRNCSTTSSIFGRVRGSSSVH